MNGIPESIRCSAYQPGHRPHYLQARMLREAADHLSPLKVTCVEMLGQTSLRVTLEDGSVKAFRNHHPERARAAWAMHRERTVLYARKNLLGVRRPKVSSGNVTQSEYLFSLSISGYRTCADLASEFTQPVERGRERR